MLEMLYQQGSHWPMVRCDACGELITDHAAAHVLWNGLADSSPVYHVHKGPCDQWMEITIEAEGGSSRWDNLDMYLVRLGYHVGLKHTNDFAKAKAKVRFEARHFST